MNFLREEGFVELELHEIKYRDPEKKEYEFEKIFIPVDVLGKQNIDQSFMYRFLYYEFEYYILDRTCIYGARHTPAQRKQLLEELKKKSAALRKQVVEELTNKSVMTSSEKQELNIFGTSNINSNNKKIDNNNQNLIQQKNKINLSSEKQESNMLNPFSAQSNNKKIDNKNQNLISQNEINLSSEKQAPNVSDTSNIESNNKKTVAKQISKAQDQNKKNSEVPNLDQLQSKYK